MTYQAEPSFVHGTPEKTGILLVIVTHFALFKTRWGLRTRSVGEHPRAADTVGINVYRTRYISVLIGGIMAGLGGAYFTLESVPSFEPMMTNGRGFIALAAMIFGNWTPFGSWMASLVFGKVRRLSRGEPALSCISAVDPI